jgi:outer membrane immunogenic protein
MTSNSKRMSQAVAVAAAMAVLALSGAAQADGPYKVPPRQVYAPPPPPPPPPLPPPFTWTGFYIGGNIGGAWASGTLTDNFTDVSFDTDHSGFIGGVQLGYNYQFRNLVIGVEWDFDWTSIGETSNSVFVPGFGTLRASADTDWITTLSARAGLTFDRWLVFVKAGGGWVQNSTSITNLDSGAVISTSRTNSGWLVGGGVEYAFNGLEWTRWTAKLEYDFLQLSDRTATGFSGDTFTFERDIQMLKFGLSYRF